MKRRQHHFMKHFPVLFALLITCLTAYAQQAIPPGYQRYAEVDKTALAIPESQTENTQQIADYITAHFKTDSDKVRAIFTWVSSNISYDQHFKDGFIHFVNDVNTVGRDSERVEKITKVLEKRKGVCMHFAALFNDICLKSGLRSYLLDGYTKQNGTIGKIAHAWCATQINGQWHMFDPTWESCYRARATGRALLETADSFYNIPPSTFVASHMPYDPMWQFLEHPITNQDFYDGKTTGNSEAPVFNYTDSIAAYERLDSAQQCAVATRRIKANGVKYGHAAEELSLLALTSEAYKRHRYELVYAEAMGAYHEAVGKINKAIDYINANRLRKTDATVQEMIDKADDNAKLAKTKLSSIKDPDKEMAVTMVSSSQALDKLITQIQQIKDQLKGK